MGKWQFQTYRLVKEEKQFGLRGEFDTDSDALSLFHRKTGFRATNDGIGDILHFEQGDDFLHVGILLFLRCLVRLSKDC